MFRCSGIVDLFGSRSFRAGFVDGSVMSSLSRELVFLILQFLDEEKFKETVHKYVSFCEKLNFYSRFLFLFFFLYI